MNYCIADIHGCYDAYRGLLDKIGFSGGDMLYVLGDVVDRGPDGVKVLLDMMDRPNVVPILGNHEYMAAMCLQLLLEEITDRSIAALEGEALSGLANWLENGGGPTLRQFRDLSAGDRRAVMEYLGEFSLFEEVYAGGHDHVLVHAGLDGFAPERELEDYGLHELIFHRPDYTRVYFPDRYLVTGHAPTRSIPGNPRPDRIWRGSHHIAIDCGCAFGGVLGAICLDTGEEFYAQ